MTQPALAYRWSQSEFVRAWEAKAFDHRVELVEGEIWPVVIGSWHGDAVGQVLALLPRVGVRVTTATLPTGGSLPDPDCWVRRADAEPVGTIGTRLSVWDAADVLLVVEVADETTIQDLNVKARLYGQAGYAVYWVITQEAIYEHTGPIATGYRTRVEYLHGERISVPYAGVELAVDDLIASDLA
ncbi:Uma2 family endonuclease [Dactylosporangium vinaceum]|uniref:Uma2 family endonuclease n=1 Tax=Dactylosporangium vinaceum TaxID=53362 RepID=A0ABV5MQH8_9ACTN|nr:Uma2 family endonuclease [Dactylosporangium vinaceum]UAB96491.1 Uma2 family endonuclease [Dactylosporangium vinaceum]